MHSLFETAKNIFALIGAGSVLATLILLVFALFSHFRKF
jgi:hypothetical protein